MKPKLLSETGGPAFPIPLQENAAWCFEQRGGDEFGMTLRDYFAAKALAALIVGGHSASFGTNPGSDNKTYAEVSYSLADAMLEARK
jgi:hypothetical protein